MLFTELCDHLHTIAFNKDATAYELMQIVLSFSVFWFIVFDIAGRILLKLTYDKPLLKSACEREYERSDMKEWIEYSHGMDYSKEQAIDDMMKDWPEIQVMMIQHTVGGLLCVPSLIGYGDPAWATSLAVLGILSEMGWEVEHMIMTLIKRYRKGKDEVPNWLMIVLAFHHSLTTMLALPMVLSYRALRALHVICFDLQITGAMMALNEYGKLLDLKKTSDLMQFKIVIFVQVVFNIWTRLIHWIYNCVVIFLAWWSDEAWTFVMVGTLPILAIAVVESLPKNASEAKKRESIANLDEAVAELIAAEHDPVGQMADYVIKALEDTPARAIGRSQTMKPKRYSAPRKSVKLMRFSSVPNNIKFKDM